MKTEDRSWRTIFVNTRRREKTYHEAKNEIKELIHDIKIQNIENIGVSCRLSSTFFLILNLLTLYYHFFVFCWNFMISLFFLLILLQHFPFIFFSSSPFCFFNYSFFVFCNSSHFFNYSSPSLFFFFLLH